MALTAQETANEITYTDTGTGTVITIAKDADNLDVRQVTPVEHASGQTWQTVKNYLDSKL